MKFFDGIALFGELRVVGGFCYRFLDGMRCLKAQEAVASLNCNL